MGVKKFEASEVRSRATGAWLGILKGLAPRELGPACERVGKHVACPIHGTKKGARGDGFRLLGKHVHLSGGSVCNTCGVFSDGFATLMAVKGWDFPTTLEQVAGYLGMSAEAPAATPRQNLRVVHSAPVASQPADTRPQERIDKIWEESLVLSDAPAAVSQYLRYRGSKLKLNAFPADSVRFHPGLEYWGDKDGKPALVGTFPAIILAYRGLDGQVVTLHRQYLSPEGRKAPVDTPKKMMPVPGGKSLTGAAVKLGVPRGVLSVCEGFETSLAPFELYRDIPVWSYGSATLLESAQLPASVHTVLVWADKDKSGRGQEAALKLKGRLEANGVKAHILVPPVEIPSGSKGVDWNDVLTMYGKAGFPSRSLIELLTGDRHAG